MKAVDITSSTLCTRLGDERTPSSIERVRGQRYWAGAEIRAQVWYLAEAYVISAKPRLVSFVTTVLEEAQAFLRRHDTAEWSRVYVRLRAPLSEGYGMLFEELQDVYSSANGNLIFHLANGLVVMEHGALKSPAQQEYSALHRRFTKGRSSSLLY